VGETRTREGLLELFEEHLGFLEASNSLFDDGKLAEAKRMAVSLRVLFHHTGSSHALLNQLGLHDKLTWVDTGGMPDPSNPMPDWGLIVSGINIENGKGTPVFKAPLGNRGRTHIRTKGMRLPIGSRIPFDEWWNEDVVRDADHNFFTRKDFVLALVNKEGGAHVDPQIKESYNRIANLNSMGWTYSESETGEKALTGPMIPVGPNWGQPTSSKPPMAQKGWSDPIALDNPVPYTMRQISYEVLESVRQQRDRIK
jgi:hypothetical protein